MKKAFDYSPGHIPMSVNEGGSPNPGSKDPKENLDKGLIRELRGGGARSMDRSSTGGQKLSMGAIANDT